MRVAIRNVAGETVKEIELRDDIFGIEPNQAVMHQAVVMQQANARLGTQKAKSRAEVSGGGRKPWRQKGTGRARQGSIRAPQFKGGGVVFAASPRLYTQKMNRKMRRLALRSALSVKAGESRIIVMDDLTLEAKTKAMKVCLGNLGVDGSALVLLAERNANVEQAARNLGEIKTLAAGCLNVRDLLKYEYVIIPVDAVELIESWLGQAA